MKNFGIILALVALAGSLAFGQTWNEVTDSAAIYYRDGNYGASLRCAEAALPLAEKEFGKADSNYATTLNILGVICYTMHRFDEAESCYKEAMTIRKKTSGDSSAVYAVSVENLALLYMKMERYADAEPLYKEVITIQKERLGEQHPDYATSLNNLAILYYDAGRYAEAEPLYIKALKIRKTAPGDTSADYASSLNNLALLYAHFLRYAEAEPLYKEAVAIRERQLGKDHPDYAASLNNLARLYREMGRYADAEPLFTEVLAFRERQLGKGHPEYAASLNNLAGLDEDMGRYTDAEPLFKEAIKIQKERLGEHHIDYANSLNSLAGLYRRMGRYADAEPLYKQAIRIRKEAQDDTSADYASFLNNFALLYTDMGRLTDAEPLFKEATKIDSLRLGGDHPGYATSLSNFAGLYRAMGRYADAAPLLTRALNIRKKQFGENHPDYATSLNNLAAVYEAMGRYTDAEPLFREALRIEKERLGPYHPDYATVLNYLALLYTDMGRYAEAEPFFTQGFATVLHAFNTVSASLSEREKEQYYKTLKDFFELFNSFALVRAAQHPAILDSLYAFRLPTKGILQQATTRMRTNILRSNDSVLEKDYATWKAGKDFLARLYTMNKEELKQQQVDIDTLETMVNTLEKGLLQRSGMAAGATGDVRITPEGVRQALGNDEAAIELIRFHWYDKHPTDTICYAAVILRGDRKDHPEIATLMNGNELETRCLKAYRAAVSVHGRDLAALDRGVAREEETDSLPAPEDLYGKYWKKIQEKLSGIKRVYLSVDGVFNQINIGTLYDPETKKYLFEDLDIRLVTNTRQVALNRKHDGPGAAGKTAELFGYPNYDLGSDRQELLAASYRRAGETRDGNFSGSGDSLKGMTFAPLPGTKTEVEEVASLLRKSGWSAGVHLADDALEEAVKAVKNPRVLMLSTHGYFLEDVRTGQKGGIMMGMQSERIAGNPLLRSGLILAGANRTLHEGNNVQSINTTDNGILTAYEAMNLNLDSTELVVLSACETGRGEISNGEGVYGLQRAFEVAGAKSILMSLWSVSDEATQMLMSAFYKYWLSGMDKHDALKQAQREVREKFPQPFFWGAFVLVGE